MTYSVLIQMDESISPLNPSDPATTVYTPEQAGAFTTTDRRLAQMMLMQAQAAGHKACIVRG